MANAMAEPMANAWQNDGQSQSQSQKKERTPSPPSVARSPKGSRLSSDWRPDGEEAGFADKLGLNPDAVAAQFRDYWHAKPGKDALKVDWSAAWRSWCRRETERGPQRAGGRQPESKLSWMLNPGSEKPQ